MHESALLVKVFPISTVYLGHFSDFCTVANAHSFTHMNNFGTTFKKQAKSTEKEIKLPDLPIHHILFIMRCFKTSCRLMSKMWKPPLPIELVGIGEKCDCTLVKCGTFFCVCHSSSCPSLVYACTLSLRLILTKNFHCVHCWNAISGSVLKFILYSKSAAHNNLRQHPYSF